MNENIDMWITFIFLITIGIMFILAGVCGWQYPLAFRWESMTDSQKLWIRIIKIIVGVIISLATLIGLFDKLL